MRKLFFTLLLFFPFTLCEAQVLVYSPTSHSMDFGVSVGTSFYMGEYDWEAGFKDWWTFPAVNLSATYWMTRCIGVGGDLFYRKYKGLGSPNDPKSTFGKLGDPMYGSTAFSQATGSYMGFVANGCLDVTRLFHWDVRGEFRFVMFVGAGAVVAMKAATHAKDWTAQGGFRSQWKLNERWDLDAVITGSLISDKFDGEYGSVSDNNIPIDGTISLLIGFTYKM